MYRDIFEIITPGWMVLMAALFKIFGTDLATARLATATIHGLTAVLAYLTCRRLGLSRALSALPGLAQVVICQPAWPIASQHWLGTILTVLALYVCSSRRGERAAWAVLPGLVLGALVAVHQQRGAMMAVGVAAWLAGDYAVRRRYRTAPPLGALVREIAAFATGVLLVVVPMLVVIVARAGFENVWRALVIHPLFNYRQHIHCPWGAVSLLTGSLASFTFPRLLKALPAVLLLDLGRFAWLVARREDAGTARRLLLLMVFCLFCMASIAYFPDFIHIAFIAPLFFVAVAEAAAWIFGALPVPPAAERVALSVGMAVLLVLSAARLYRNLVRSRALYPYEMQTAFGRVDLRDPKDMKLYALLSRLMRDVPSRRLYCYPVFSDLYLTVDANNPTRYQFFMPGYNAPDQFDEVVRTLQKARLPYIVALPAFAQPGDSIMAYIRRDYEPLPETADWVRVIYRRKENGREPPSQGR